MKFDISKVLICIFVVVGTVDIVNSFPSYNHMDEKSKTSIPRLLDQKINETGAPVECCPSVVELIQPVGGKNIQGLYVELFRVETYVQTFYEYSCVSPIIDETCRNIDPRLAKQSKCVQKYAFNYALVLNTETTTPADEGSPYNGVLSNIAVGTSSDKWSLDYIELRSGCEFQLLGPLVTNESVKDIPTPGNEIVKAH